MNCVVTVCFYVVKVDCEMLAKSAMVPVSTSKDRVLHFVTKVSVAEKIGWINQVGVLTGRLTGKEFMEQGTDVLQNVSLLHILKHIYWPGYIKSPSR